MNLFKSSWRTSLGGVGAILGAILIAVSFTFDNDPKTNTDWNDVFRLAGELWIAIGSAQTGLTARDNKVSSEAARDSGTLVE